MYSGYDQAGAESMGNGSYLIAYTVRDDQGGNNSTDIYYRIFDSELGSFAGGIDIFRLDGLCRPCIYDRQEDGRVLINDNMNY